MDKKLPARERRENGRISVGEQLGVATLFRFFYGLHDYFEKILAELSLSV